MYVSPQKRLPYDLEFDLNPLIFMDSNSLSKVRTFAPWTKIATILIR
jgi:hypothetical protein